MTNGTRRFCRYHKTKASGTDNDPDTIDDPQHVYAKWRDREAETLSVVADY
jgi:hypothetical protein